MHRLHVQLRREALALGLLAAERDHVGRDVAAVDVQAGSEVGNEQAPGPAGDVQRGLPVVSMNLLEVRDLLRAEVVVELGPLPSDEPVVPGRRLLGRHRQQAYDASVPELPEVETIRARSRRASRAGLLRGRDPRPAATRPYDLFEVAEELEGERVLAVERRGKYLVFRLESGLSLLVHLRMTGSFGFLPTSHERAVLKLDDGIADRVTATFAASARGSFSRTRSARPSLGQASARSRSARAFNAGWLAGASRGGARR